jgi:UDP-glucose 4-epimerase
VEDLSDVHTRAVEAQEQGRFAGYNIGTGVGVTVKNSLPQRGSDQLIPRKSPRREGDPPELYANASKAAADLGWRARFTDIRRTLETAWKWHRSHPRGFASSLPGRAIS